MDALTKTFITLMIISSVLNLSDAQVKFSKKIGGSNGSDFMIPSSRQDVLSTERIVSIAIQHSRRIEQIEVEYSNGKTISQFESVGNDAGEWSFIDLEEGEFIVYITGRAGTLIDQLTFHTSMRRTFGPYGGTGGKDFEISIPSDAKVIGFTGKAGPGINQIGLIYKRSGKVSGISENRHRGTRYEGTNGDEIAKSNSRTVRDHRTNGAKKRTVRDHRTKKSDSTIRESKSVVKYTLPDRIGKNGSSNQDQETSASISTGKKINNLLIMTRKSGYHSDSLNVMHPAQLNLSKMFRPSTKKKIKTSQKQRVKRTTSPHNSRIRDHRNK